MLPKRPGFTFSLLKRGATFTLVIILGLILHSTLKEYLMPGPVSAAQPHGEALGGFSSHASFEHECGHCHAPVHCVTDTRCQDCHMEIARQRETAEGLHGRLPGTIQCQNCHIEHQGRDAAISHVSFINVDHEQLTGFSLDRHHIGYDDQHLICESCHIDSRFSAEAVDCLSCHVQADHDFMAAHLELFGSDCLDCHDGRDRMTNFDHNQTFVLDGAHEIALCESCHVDQVFAGAPRECADCHEKSSAKPEMFSSDCTRCHTTVAWTPAQLSYHIFPLDHGEAGEIACQTCHLTTYAEHTCYGCHDHTPEQMQEIHLAVDILAFENCAECHPIGLVDEIRGDSNTSTD